MHITCLGLNIIQKVKALMSLSPSGKTGSLVVV